MTHSEPSLAMADTTSLQPPSRNRSTPRSATQTSTPPTTAPSTPTGVPEETFTTPLHPRQKAQSVGSGIVNESPVAPASPSNKSLSLDSGSNQRLRRQSYNVGGILVHAESPMLSSSDGKITTPMTTGRASLQNKISSLPPLTPPLHGGGGSFNGNSGSLSKNRVKAFQKNGLSPPRPVKSRSSLHHHGSNTSQPRRKARSVGGNIHGDSATAAAADTTNTHNGGDRRNDLERSSSFVVKDRVAAFQNNQKHRSSSFHSPQQRQNQQGMITTPQTTGRATMGRKASQLPAGLAPPLSSGSFSSARKLSKDRIAAFQKSYEKKHSPVSRSSSFSISKNQQKPSAVARSSSFSSSPIATAGGDGGGDISPLASPSPFMSPNSRRWSRKLTDDNGKLMEVPLLFQDWMSNSSRSLMSLPVQPTNGGGGPADDILETQSVHAGSANDNRRKLELDDDLINKHLSMSLHGAAGSPIGTNSQSSTPIQSPRRRWSRQVDGGGEAAEIPLLFQEWMSNSNRSLMSTTSTNAATAGTTSTKGRSSKSPTKPKAKMHQLVHSALERSQSEPPIPSTSDHSGSVGRLEIHWPPTRARRRMRSLAWQRAEEEGLVVGGGQDGKRNSIVKSRRTSFEPSNLLDVQRHSSYPTTQLEKDGKRKKKHGTRRRTNIRIRYAGNTRFGSIETICTKLQELGIMNETFDPSLLQQEDFLSGLQVLVHDQEEQGPGGDDTANKKNTSWWYDDENDENDSQELNHGRPDIWITPLLHAPSNDEDDDDNAGSGDQTASHGSRNPNWWRVKRVWNYSRFDEGEKEHYVKNSELLGTVKTLLGVCDEDVLGKLELSEHPHGDDTADSKNTLWNATWIYDEGGEVVMDEASLDLNKPWGSRTIIATNNDSINTGSTDHRHLVDGRWMFVPGSGKQADDDEDVSKPWGEKLQNSGDITANVDEGENVVDGQWIYGNGEDGMEDFNDWIDESKMMDMFQAVIENEADQDVEPPEESRPRNRRTYAIKGEIAIPSQSDHSALTMATAETTHRDDQQQHTDSIPVETEVDEEVESTKPARRSYYKIIREIEPPKASEDLEAPHDSESDEEGEKADVGSTPVVETKPNAPSEESPPPASSRAEIDEKEAEPPTSSEDNSAKPPAAAKKPDAAPTHPAFVSIPVTTKVPLVKKSRLVVDSRCKMMDLLDPPPRIYFG